MTAEVKYFLDLGDILGIQLECCNPECQVRTSFPVLKLTRMPHECPHCKAGWVFPDTNEEKAISAFLVSLGRVADALKGRAFKLSLEVNYEEGEAPI
jgi:hypothetical protein